MSNQELASLTLRTEVLDAQYTKWAEEDQSLGSVLNAKVTKAANTDFHAKMECWKKRAAERKKNKKRLFEHGKALRKVFTDVKESFNLDREMVAECFDIYNENVEDYKVK